MRFHQVLSMNEIANVNGGTLDGGKPNPTMPG
jgi:hypothetical protein